MLAMSCGVVLLATPRFVPGSAPGSSNCKNPYYTDLSGRFGYPAEEKKLDELAQKPNAEKIRHHGWNLWMELCEAAEVGLPVWETWYPADEVFAGPPSSEHAAAIAAPDEPGRQLSFSWLRQHELADDESDDSLNSAEPRRPLMSTVLFNKAARDHIHRKRLYEPATLDNLRSHEVPEIAAFDIDEGAVVVKTVWWLIRQSPADGPKRLSVLPVWDADNVQEASERHPHQRWNRVVAVDPTRARVPTGTTVSVNHDLYQKQARVVSLRDMYHFQFQTEEEIASATNVIRRQRGDIDQIQKGDYAALVAMHVATKERKDWVWATYWWHDLPHRGDFALGRPKEVTHEWRNYLMDITLSANTPAEYDGNPNVCFNPWIEGRMKSGVESNCVSCHQRASWPRPADVSVTRGEMGQGDPIRSKHTRTDYLWSIVIRNTEKAAQARRE